jgi:aquaporin Z
VFQCGTALTNLWIFIVGPFVGAILAAIIWKIVEPKEEA